MVIFFLFILSLFFSCGKKEKTGKEETKAGNKGIEIKSKNGINYVFNPSKPLKGSVSLELEKILELDNLNNPNVPISFNRFAHDQQGNIYLVNIGEVKVYKFNKDGKFLGEFLNKGEGPGEFTQQIGGLEIIGNDLWASHARKIAKYDLIGTFIGESKFDKSYTHIGIVDANRFIANFYEYSKKEKEAFKPLKRVCALIQKDQTVRVKLFEAENAGFTELRSKNKISRIYSGSFTNDILHAYNPETGVVYIFLTSEYKIVLKNITGETQLIIHRKHQNKIIDESVKQDILEFFKHMPPDEFQLLKKNLPGSLCAITRIEFLPKGYIAVHRKTGFRKDEIDVFDREGRFVYILKPSEEIPNYIRFRFYKNKGMIIKNFEDRDVYIQYKIKNLPEIFGN